MDLDAFDADGLTALHRAVAAGDHPAAADLIEAGANPGVRNDTKPSSGRRSLTDGGPPLLLAVDRGDRALVELLLKGKGRKKARAGTGNGCGLTPLHVAAGRGHLELVALLLDKKAKLEAKLKTAEGHLQLDTGARPLHAACSGGAQDVVALLLDRGAELEALDEYHATPLVHAARAGNDAVVALLLERGARPLGHSQGQSPIAGAAASGQGSTVRLLREAGASLDPPRGEPLLHLAARNLRADATQALLDLGCDPNEADVRGWRPLHHAAYGGNPEAAQLLLDAGAEADAPTGVLANYSAIIHLTLGWCRWHHKTQVPAGTTAAQVAGLARFETARANEAEEAARQAWNARCDAVAALLA